MVSGPSTPFSRSGFRFERRGEPSTSMWPPALHSSPKKALGSVYPSFPRASNRNIRPAPRQKRIAPRGSYGIVPAMTQFAPLSYARIREFFRLEAAGGIVLGAAALLAIILVNSPLS